MGRDLVDDECDRFRPAGLCQEEPVPLMDGESPPPVGECEGVLPAAAVGRTDELEEGLIRPP